jgi:phytanoyl-CoA hydroxylase
MGFLCFHLEFHLCLPHSFVAKKNIMSNINQFWQDFGYYHAQGVFSADELALMEGDFDRIVAQMSNAGEDLNARWQGEEMARLDGGQSVIFHTHQVQTFSAQWLRAIQNPRFLDVMEALIGPDIILHHTKLFQKPAENGSPFPMHQDYTYFPSVQDTMMAGVIFVSDATDEMGCLRVYPASHKLGRVQRGEVLQEGLREEYPIENALVIEAKAGDVVFFNYLTLHGSMPNRSKQVRKTVLVQAHAGADEMEQPHTHTYSGLTLRGWNYAATRSKAAAAG